MADINNSTSNTVVSGNQYANNSIYNTGDNVTINGGGNGNYHQDYIENRGSNAVIYAKAGGDTIVNYGNSSYIHTGDNGAADKTTNYGKNVTIDSGYGNDTITTYGDSSVVTLGTDNNSVNAFANNVVVKVSRGNQIIPRVFHKL